MPCFSSPSCHIAREILWMATILASDRPRSKPARQTGRQIIWVSSSSSMWRAYRIPWFQDMFFFGQSSQVGIKTAVVFFKIFSSLSWEFTDATTIVFTLPFDREILCNIAPLLDLSDPTKNLHYFRKCTKLFTWNFLCVKKIFYLLAAMARKRKQNCSCSLLYLIFIFFVFTKPTTLVSGCRRCLFSLVRSLQLGA